MRVVLLILATAVFGVGLPFLICRWAMSRVDAVLGVTIRRRR